MNGTRTNYLLEHVEMTPLFTSLFDQQDKQTSILSRKKVKVEIPPVSEVLNYARKKLSAMPLMTRYTLI